MIDFDYEEKKRLTTEQITIIFDAAAQAASDGGFISSFIFERAIYVFAAQLLYPDKKNTIASAIGAGYDIRLAFDNLVKDGTIKEMVKDYQDEIDMLEHDGKIWLKEVEEFQRSARGLLDSITTLSGDIVKSAADQLQKTANGDVQFIQQFAEKWGLNRDDKNLVPDKNANLTLME